MTLDVGLGAVIAVFAVMGFWRGFLRSMGGFLAIGVGYWVTYHHGATGWGWLPMAEGWGVTGTWWGYVGCFLVTYAVMIAAVSMLSRMVSWSGLGLPNRVLGAVLGVLKGVLVVWLLVMPLRWVMPEQVAPAVIPAWLDAQWASYGWLSAWVPRIKGF